MNSQPSNSTINKISPTKPHSDKLPKVSNSSEVVAKETTMETAAFESNSGSSKADVSSNTTVVPEKAAIEVKAKSEKIPVEAKSEPEKVQEVKVEDTKISVEIKSEPKKVAEVEAEPTKKSVDIEKEPFELSVENKVEAEKVAEVKAEHTKESVDIKKELFELSVENKVEAEKVAEVKAEPIKELVKIQKELVELPVEKKVEVQKVEVDTKIVPKSSSDNRETEVLLNTESTNQNNATITPELVNVTSEKIADSTTEDQINKGENNQNSEKQISTKIAELNVKIDEKKIVLEQSTAAQEKVESPEKNEQTNSVKEVDNATINQDKSIDTETQEESSNIQKLNESTRPTEIKDVNDKNEDEKTDTQQIIKEDETNSEKLSNALLEIKTDSTVESEKSENEKPKDNANTVMKIIQAETSSEFEIIEDINTHIMNLINSRKLNDKASKKELQTYTGQLVSLLKDRTTLCCGLNKKNEALSNQIISLKSIISITKDLLNLRNMEVEHLKRDLGVMEEGINAERARHNNLLEKLNLSMKLNHQLKHEYEIQQDLFQNLRGKYVEKVQLLEIEISRLRNIVNESIEGESTTTPADEQSTNSTTTEANAATTALESTTSICNGDVIPPTN